MNTLTSDQKFGVTEGLLLAAVPAAGYWLAFLFELGYCGYFDIPTQFVEISITNILFAILGLFGVLATLHMYAQAFYSVGRHIPQVIRNSLIKLALVSLPMAGIALVDRMSPRTIAVVFGPLVFSVVFAEFILPLFNHRETNGYLNKLKAQHKTDIQQPELLDPIAKAIGRNGLLIILIIIILSFCAYFAGGYTAKIKRDFMVVIGHHESVVVKHYSGQFLVSPFNRQHKSISAMYELISPESGRFRFKYERIGPITPDGLDNANESGNSENKK